MPTQGKCVCVCATGTDGSRYGEVRYGGPEYGHQSSSGNGHSRILRGREGGVTGHATPHARVQNPVSYEEHPSNSKNVDSNQTSLDSRAEQDETGEERKGEGRREGRRRQGVRWLSGWGIRLLIRRLPV